jgi:hypothetical protein
MKQLWMVVVLAGGCYTQASQATTTPAASATDDASTWNPANPDPAWDYRAANQDDSTPAPAPDYSQQNAQIQQQNDAIYEQSQQQLSDYANSVLSEPVPGPETLAPPPAPPTYDQ